MTFRALESLVLLEEDHNEEVLITWAYPTLEASSIITQRGRVLFTQAKTVEDATQPFLLTHRINNNWCYSCIFPSSQNSSENQSGVLRYQIILTAEDYHPAQYLALAELLCKYYVTKLTPLCLLDCFIKVFTTSKLTLPNGEFQVSNYNKSMLLTDLNIKKLIQRFNEEIILLWNGLILKKRILVYSSNVQELSSVMSVLPIFVCHRAEWSEYFWPFITETPEELEALSRSSLYVAGIVSDLNSSKIEYDLLVNLDDQSISIHQDAKSEFILNSYHKGLMTSLLEWGNDDNLSNADVISQIHVQTEELLHSIPKYLALQRQAEGSKPFLTFISRLAHIEGVSESESDSSSPSEQPSSSTKEDESS